VLVTVLVPTLNEEGGIGPTIDSIDRAAFASRGWGLEVLVVDGASKDRTVAIAESKGARIVVEPRRGYGLAYKRGFSESRGDVIVTGDADGSYPLERAHEYVDRLLADGLEFMTCDRYGHLSQGAMSAKHRFGNWALSATARTLFRIRLRDSQSGMWILRREALPRLGLDHLSNGMAFSQEIKIAAFRNGLRAAEVPASLRPRIGKPVLSSWRDGLKNLGGLFALRLRRRSSAR